jgi:hypothetical protein
VGGGSGVAVGRRRVVVGGRVIVAGPLYIWCFLQLRVGSLPSRSFIRPMIDGLASVWPTKKQKKCTGARSSLARKRSIQTGMSALSVGLQPLVQALVTELPRDTPLKV